MTSNYSTEEHDINLSVLQQKDPYITGISDSATQVAVYSFNTKMSEWEKTNVEGTLFVYTRSVFPLNGFMIINRLHLNDLIEPINKNLEFQLQDPFLLYRNSQTSIFGIWFYDKDECARIGQLMNSLVQVSIENLHKEQGGRQRRASESDSIKERVTTSSVAVNSNVSPSKNVDILQMLSKAQDEYDKSKVYPSKKSKVTNSDTNNINTTLQSQTGNVGGKMGASNVKVSENNNSSLTFKQHGNTNNAIQSHIQQQTQISLESLFKRAASQQHDNNIETKLPSNVHLPSILQANNQHIPPTVEEIERAHLESEFSSTPQGPAMVFSQTRALNLNSFGNKNYNQIIQINSTRPVTTESINFALRKTLNIAPLPYTQNDSSSQSQISNTVSPSHQVKVNNQAFNKNRVQKEAGKNLQSEKCTNSLSGNNLQSGQNSVSMTFPNCQTRSIQHVQQFKDSPNFNYSTSMVEKFFSYAESTKSKDMNVNQNKSVFNRSNSLANSTPIPLSMIPPIPSIMTDANFTVSPTNLFEKYSIKPQKHYNHVKPAISSSNAMYKNNYGLIKSLLNPINMNSNGDGNRLLNNLEIDRTSSDKFVLINSMLIPSSSGDNASTIGSLKSLVTDQLATPENYFSSLKADVTSTGNFLISPMDFQNSVNVLKNTKMVSPDEHMNLSCSFKFKQISTALPSNRDIAAIYTQPSSYNQNDNKMSVAALTKEQLQQALISLLKSDTNFLSAIHEAYISSLNKEITRGFKNVDN